MCISYFTFIYYLALAVREILCPLYVMYFNYFGQLDGLRFRMVYFCMLSFYFSFVTFACDYTYLYLPYGSSKRIGFRIQLVFVLFGFGVYIFIQYSLNLRRTCARKIRVRYSVEEFSQQNRIDFQANVHIKYTLSLYLSQLLLFSSQIYGFLLLDGVDLWL